MPVPQARLAKRESLEASLPVLPDGRAWSNAESYVLLQSPESLNDLVFECYEKLTPSGMLYVDETRALLIHDTNTGYTREETAINSALEPLRASVRRAVSAVEVDEDDQEGLDSTMRARLGKVGTISAKIERSHIVLALCASLASDPSTVLKLDARAGLLNLIGTKVAEYNPSSGALSLVDRDPARHHVLRSTGVDCGWLASELSPQMQAQYEEFLGSKLNRWLIDAEVREYFLLATGAALFGGDTTRIKSGMVLVGDADQGKSALLAAAAVAAGYVKGSRLPSYVQPADSNALSGKSSRDTTRHAMLAAADGARLLWFSELETSNIWGGFKILTNAETEVLSTKRQSSGVTSTREVDTPYPLISCNPTKCLPARPDSSVLPKVAVVTSNFLGRFVSDGSEDGEKTFKRETFAGSDDGVRGSLARAAPTPHSSHHHPPLLPPPHTTGAHAARDGGRAQAARRAQGHPVRPRARHARVHEARASRPGHVGRGRRGCQLRTRQRRRGQCRRGQQRHGQRRRGQRRHGQRHGQRRQRQRRERDRRGRTTRTLASL